MKPPKENAAPTAMGDGTSTKEMAGKLPVDYSQKPTRSKVVLFAKTTHKLAILKIGCALVLDESYAWNKTSEFLSACLNEKERANLAQCTLKTLPRDDIEEVALKALGRTSGPLPTFISLEDDANFWASLAPTFELVAYSYAAFKYLPRHMQIKMLAQLKMEVG
ncbi:hypothetical protein [Parasedimentitalea psychrophila]|uniref:Uncharacterized protein n=1 Tax=Parasedimentitalea psychrophila TaxID=2997337 RepID=A0A9Y2KYE7_9RHOB|nr:hypothetical protein [Parasedimentitalea psychrophila]WIY24818.1 hypothetical protein QPJ95_20325 [Parasedimentitalea psychrophila]